MPLTKEILMRAEETRQALQQLIHRQPFDRFVISLENGDRLTIEHPENVAFDPTKNGGTRLCVVTANLFCYATLESVSSIIHQDTGTTVGV